MIAKITVYKAAIPRSRRPCLVSLISYTELRPVITARKPLPADQIVDTMVAEIKVVEAAVSKISRTIEEIREFTVVGKAWLNRISMLSSSTGKYLIMLKRSIIKGKKDMMMKNAACAEKAAI
jgi:uncharacterized protein with PIN domain